MSRTFLKVRIKELAQEARFIRLEEARAGKQKRALKKKQGFEAQYEHAIWKFNELKSHRKTIVRTAARETQIAYAFVRGKPFSSIERYVPPAWEIATLWKQVGRMIYKYGKTDFNPPPVILNPDNIDERKTSTRTALEPMFSYELFDAWVRGENINELNRE